MDLKEIRSKSQEMLANFIDAIGLDGEFYSQLNTTPIIWGNPKLDGLGEYISPESERLENLIQARSYDENKEKILREKGVILVSNDYRKQEPDPDLYVTLIHETIHANRNLLLFDSLREGTNEDSYSYNNEKVEQNTDVFGTTYADASQEILKGNIDNSSNVVEDYSDKTSEEIEDMEWTEGKIDGRMEKQQIVDEALVELMAAVSYKLYSSKQNGVNLDIWDAIMQAQKSYDGEDIGAICEIVLRHHDFELFNWMLDPINYSEGDIHYDFFSKYTKNDKDLLDKLYNSTLDMDEYLGLTDETIELEDIRDVATSKTAIEELTGSLQDIQLAQQINKRENER